MRWIIAEKGEGKRYRIELVVSYNAPGFPKLEAGTVWYASYFEENLNNSGRATAYSLNSGMISPFFSSQ